MAIDRVEEWRKFSQHMEKYIQDRTVVKYTMDEPGEGVDLISLAKPEICIWNILRYALRNWNGKGKQNDLVKIAHYACFAWGMKTEK